MKHKWLQFIICTIIYILAHVQCIVDWYNQVIPLVKDLSRELDLNNN